MFQWNGPEAEDSSSEDLQEVGSEDPSYSSSDDQKFWGTCSEAEVARSKESKLQSDDDQKLHQRPSEAPWSQVNWWKDMSLSQYNVVQVSVCPPPTLYSLAVWYYRIATPTDKTLATATSQVLEYLKAEERRKKLRNFAENIQHIRTILLALFLHCS